jgi:hypothetical protein
MKTKQYLELPSVNFAWSNKRTEKKGVEYSQLVADINGSVLRFFYKGKDRPSCCGKSEFKSSHYNHCHINGDVVDFEECKKHSHKSHESFLILHCRCCGKFNSKIKRFK